MVSALPGFGGHVPEAIERIIPDAELTKTADWSGFSGNLSGDALLQPADPHFVDLGTKYYKLLIEEFGTDHMFQMDTFNEMQPSYTNMTLLRESNAAVYRAMVNADPEGVYIMQGWLFHGGTYVCSACWNCRLLLVRLACAHPRLLPRHNCCAALFSNFVRSAISQRTGQTSTSRCICLVFPRKECSSLISTQRKALFGP